MTIELKKSVNGIVQNLYPKTSASIVAYGNSSVKLILDDILARLTVLENTTVKYSSADNIDDGSNENI